MEDHGNNAASTVEELLRKSYLADFVVRSPKFKKPGGQQLEASDFLLTHRGTLVTIQVKTRVVQPFNSLSADREIGRISKRINEGVEQIKTILRGIESHSIEYVENLRGIRLPFSCEIPRKIIGIVIMDPLYSDNIPQDDRMIMYAGIDEVREIPVHVFLLEDFRVLVKELDTIPDLLKYLNKREILIKRRALIFTAELDFLAVYKTDYPLVQKCLDDASVTLMVDSGTWEHVVKTHNDKFAARDERKEASILVDRTIEEVYRSIGCPKTDYGSGARGVELGYATEEDYLKIADELSSLSRLDRMHIGKMMREKVVKADTDQKGFSYFLYHMPENDRTPILYMASRQPRPDRKSMLVKLTCAASVHLGGSKIIGIATENMSVEDRSHDFLYIEKPEFENENELRRFATKIFAPSKNIKMDEWGNESVSNESE